MLCTSSIIFLALLCAIYCVMPCTCLHDYSTLRKEIEASFECHDHPGMAISIVKDGTTVFSEGFGQVLPGSNIQVTPKTKFVIASLTKAFTAAVLVDVFANNPKNKSYSLRTPLKDVLGSKFSFADEQRTKYASAEDLLSHRIGLPNKSFIRFNPAFNLSDYIAFAKDWKSNLPFRGVGRYSSMGYTLAAAITEQVGEKSWEDLINERLLLPLGMASTGFAFSTNYSDNNVAKPYSLYKGEKHFPIDPVFTRVWNKNCGAGCILSTSNDMAKWMNFILSGGKNDAGHQVLPEAEVSTLTKVRTYLPSSSRDVISKPTFPETSVGDEYSLGWRSGYYNGYKTVSHRGDSPGYGTMVMLFPDQNVGIFIAMNGDDEKGYYRLPIVHFISDFMLGRPSWLNASTLCSFPDPWKTPKFPPSPTYDAGLKPSLSYISYVGAYKHPLYGEAFINFNSSTFSLQGFYGIGSWELFPQKKKNNFYAKGMWATEFWSMSSFQFLTADNDPKNITKLVIRDFFRADPPVFEKEFN